MMGIFWFNQILNYQTRLVVLLYFVPSLSYSFISKYDLKKKVTISVSDIKIFHEPVLFIKICVSLVSLISF